MRHVYAAILAQACNFGLTTRADIADLTYRQLAWTTDWYAVDQYRPRQAGFPGKLTNAPARLRHGLSHEG